MPVFEDVDASATGFTSPVAPPKPDVPEPTWGETFSAGFRMENDVVNAVELMSKPQFEKQEGGYDWISKLKSSPYMADYAENFVGTKNEDDYNWRIQQIEGERKDRETLQRSGWAGTIAMISAGAVSPTMLLPFIGEERGLAAIFRGAQMGLAGGLIQEFPLQANQATRTLTDFAASVGSSTILSGVLGGAVGMLRPMEREYIEAGMAVSRRDITISPQSAGSAAAAPEYAGGFARGPGGVARGVMNIVDSNALTRSPVTATINAEERTPSFLMAQYADAGLSLEGNAKGIPTTPGGTIENAVQRYNWNFEQAVRSVDEQYSKYFFDQVPPKFAPNVRAAVGGYFSKEKISKSEFREAVGQALWSGDVHENPFVEAVAKQVRATVYDPILKELQSVGLLKDEIKLLADPSYINRVFNTEYIRANRKNSQGLGFKEFLQQNFQSKLEAEFSTKLEKFNKSAANRQELIQDVQRPQEEIDALRAEYLQKIKDLEGGRSESLAALEDQAATHRAEARGITGDDRASKQARRDLLDKARGLEQYAGADLTKLKNDRAELNRRLRNLNKAQIVLEAKHARKLEKIDRAEELSINGLQRVAKAGQRVLNNIDKWSDEVLNEELSKLRSQFAEVARVYDKGEERIATLSQDEGVANFVGNEADIQAGLTETGRQEVRADKMTKISEQIADAEDLGRDALRSLMHDALDETVAKVNRINNRRAVRTARLEAEAKKIEPATLDERIRAIQEEGRAKEAKFNESVRTSGADTFDAKAGTADFKRFSDEAANNVVDKILGTFIRLPTVDVMQDLRGATLTRVLDIPSADLAPWLENDVEKLIRSHIMTMGPDIEIARKFGTVNMDEILAPMWDEMHAKKDAVAGATKGEKLNADGSVKKPGKPLSDTEKERATVEIDRKYQEHKKNLIAVHERLRHTWGLPTDPEGVSYRLGKLVSNLNVLRYMGMVTVSSIPDMAQPILKYGIAHVFREAFVPLVTNFKAFKMSAREARYAGVANDAILNTRAQTVLDIADDLRRGSKFERGVDFATNRQGTIALFNHWTDIMKQFSAVSANGKLMDSVARVMKNDDKKAGAYLAEVGIGPQEAAAIWEQATKVGASDRQQGVWLPNTEAWDQGPALRYYRSALAREVNRTIVTPGVERPLWTNASQTGRLLSQFKSFTFASTQKVMVAGLQHKDARFVTGMTGSMALGALSYYLSGVTAGGETYQKMLDASPEKWADEAVQRSGMLAVFGLGQDLLTRIPVTAPYSSFSGSRSTRRGGDDLFDTVLGPTGDFAKRSADILAGVDDPTQSTVHKFRTLLPWQNLIGFRAILDQIEQAAPVPQRRQ